MNYSYTRYWEPSTAQALTSSLIVAGIATSIVQPIEFVKTRVQIKAEGIGIRQKNHYGGYNPFKTFRDIHATGGGLRQFFFGLDAALYARISHLFVRNLVYKGIYDRMKPSKATNDLSIREKAVISGFAGFLGSIASNPFEVVLVRQIYEGALPLQQRRNYKGALDGIKDLLSTEGKKGLFKGFAPTAIKAILLNITLTGCYDFLHEKMVICFGDTYFNRPSAILWAAFWGSLVSLPIDNVKTRIQKQFLDPNRNRLNYLGTADAIAKVCLNESPESLLVGFYPYYCRVAIYTTLTVYMMDKLTMRWKRNAGLPEEQI